MKLHRSAMDLTGQKFGRLTVIAPTGARKHDHIVWHCECECGGTIATTSNLLRTGQCKSCGCLKRQPLKHQHDAPVKRIEISSPSVVARIWQLAQESGTTPSTWATNALEDFILKHRSNRFVADPHRLEEERRDTLASLKQDKLNRLTAFYILRQYQKDQQRVPPADLYRFLFRHQPEVLAGLQTRLAPEVQAKVDQALETLMDSHRSALEG